MLISTKTLKPLLKNRMLDRVGLLDRLSTGKKKQLILISGSAGFGKTSLVCQWLGRNNLPHAWYSLDDTDNDPDVFFRYLLTAMLSIDDRLEEMIGPALQTQRELSAADAIPLIVQASVTLGKDAYLIFDDYHLISNNKIHNALIRLFQYQPPTLHVVIISRYTLPPTLRRMKNQLNYTEISALDLKLTQKEVVLFFRKIFPLTLDATQVSDVIAYTDGWIAGLQIIGLFFTQKGVRKDLKIFQGPARREIGEYLFYEVIQAQPEEIRLFLYQTAVLKRFNANLAKYVTGSKDAEEHVNEILRKNLFIACIDSDGQWYRYHQLFSASIRAQVDASSDLLKKTLKRAVLWFAEHNYLEDALQHAFILNDFEFVADFMEVNLDAIFKQCERSSIQWWLSKLPQDILLRHPLLRLAGCSFDILAKQISNVEHVLLDVEKNQMDLIRHYDKTKRQRCLDLIIYQKALLEFAKFQFDVDVKRLDGAIQKISNAGKPFACGIQFIIAHIHTFHGKPQYAEKRLKIVSENMLPSEDNSLRIRWARIMATNLKVQGQLRQAEKTLRNTFLFFEKQPPPALSLKYLIYGGMADIYFSQYRLDLAYEYGVIALRYAKQTKDFEGTVNGLNQLAAISMIKGDIETANDYKKQLQVVAKQTNHAYWLRFADAVLLFLEMRCGNVAVVHRWADRRNLRIDERFSLVFVMEALALAVFFLSQGKTDESIALLKKLRARCVRRNILEAVLNIDILYSTILINQEKRDKAKDILDHALQFGETEGYVQPFVSNANIIAPLLDNIINDRLCRRQSDYLSNLLHLCTVKHSVSPSATPETKEKNNFNMTKKEIEILKYIAAGYRNKEIAEKNFISINTVKTHAQNIFRKLDVGGRLEAIRRARELNLISAIDVL